MKKTILSIAFVASAVIFMFSCSKKTDAPQKQSSNSLARTVSTSNANLNLAYDLASNQDFADFVKSYGTNSFEFYNALKEKDIYKNSTIEEFASTNTLEGFQNLSVKYNLNLDLIKETYTDPLAHFVYFLKKNTEYASLSQDDLKEVISNVFSTVINDEQYLNDNPDSPLLKALNDIAIVVNTQNSARGITASEVGGCIAAAAGSFIAENWGAIKNLYAVLSGEGLTFGVVKSAAELFFPEIKGVWTICTLVGCLIGAALN